MKVIYNNIIPFRGFTAINLFGFIFARKEYKPLPEIRAYLSGLKLEIKGNWQVFPVEARGIDFLGYVFYNTHTRLRKSIKKRMFQKACVLRRHSPGMAKPHIAAWWGWMKHADCRNLSRKLLNRFEYEIKFN